MTEPIKIEVQLAEVILMEPVKVDERLVEVILSVPKSMADALLLMQKAGEWSMGTLRLKLEHVFYCKHAEKFQDNRWYRIVKGREPAPLTKRYLTTCTVCWSEHIAIFPVDEFPEEDAYRCRECGLQTRRIFVPYQMNIDHHMALAQEPGIEVEWAMGEIRNPYYKPARAEETCGCGECGCAEAAR